MQNYKEEVIKFMKRIDRTINKAMKLIEAPDNNKCPIKIIEELYNLYREQEEKNYGLNISRKSGSSSNYWKLANIKWAIQKLQEKYSNSRNVGDMTTHGIIQDKYLDQYLINNTWYHKSIIDKVIEI